ncbi:energy transducer TonB [Aliidiomarina indica]|uniref:energy transducer TonB n=1 Tax=Aliidiomarina indica TaxID=2749147 RepID=UPI00188E49A0|nr:energy transducer TonB [Aliidiomarina indica]
MVRILVSILLGAAVTFLLFVFMAYLISGGEKRAEPSEPPTRIDIVGAPPEQDVDTRRRTPPPPPEPPEPPPESPQTEPDASDDTVSFSMDLGGVDLGSANTGLDGPGALSRDGDAQPIVRVEPRYPPAAARDGIEGWVRLRFTIDETGGVTDIEIIDAQPRRIFDQEARRALARWRYAPKVVDGRPQRQEGLTVQLDFTMD